MADRPQRRSTARPGTKAAGKGSRKPSKRKRPAGSARPGPAGNASSIAIDAGAVNDRSSPRIPAETAGIRGGRGRSTIIGNAGLNKSAGPQRLQKVLAAAGIGSRRQCEELILAGRVEVDRKVVMELGVRVDPAQQEIRLDGEVLARPRVAQLLYYAVNKPRGVVSTSRDPSGRPRVVDLIPQERSRVFAVGRLDMYSEGLILLTNDGDLANQLTHPRYGIEKTYRVLVAGRPNPEVLDQLRRGVHLAEGVARADRVTVKGHHGKATWLEIVLSEGKNREIRRILARVGHKVLQLIRIAVGPIRLGSLGPGEHRRLVGGEVQALRKAVRRIG